MKRIGIKKSNGYVRIYRPDHPRADCRGFVNRSLLVAESFIGRYIEAGEDVHHVNGIKDDDRPENLEVIAHSEHVREHRLADYASGRRSTVGEKNPKAKLTPSDVVQIRSLEGTMRRDEIARLFNISMSNVSSILSKKIWAHVA